jgi:hypothetical protein
MEGVTKQYFNLAQQRALLIDPWSYYGILGRGAGKTVGILAPRSAMRAYDMPRASFGIVSDTYVNALAKIVPSMVRGWENLGYKEGYHFTVDQRPPDHFAQPLFRTYRYKHTIYWHTGAVFFIISQDRPGTANGLSLQHLFGDEVKFLDFNKMKTELFPTLRGERLHFGHSPHFQGMTFTTDMPRIEDGDWLFDIEQQMDKQQIEIIIMTSLALEDLKMKRLKSRSPINIEKLDRGIKAWEKKLAKLRKKSIYFDTASSFVNVDVNGLEYMDNMMSSMGFRDFKMAGLNIRPDSTEEMFYTNLGTKHFYTAYDYDHYDSYRLLDTISIDSRGDKDCDPKKELICGMDFGNMNSLTVAQLHGKEFRVIKFIYTLDPHIIQDTAKRFADYYRTHQRKVVKLYYDRAGNSRRNERTTLAQQFKQDLESLNDGWRVELMSLNQGNIPHEAKRLLWQIILTEKDQRFPYFRMNEANCRELKSSMQLAPVIVTRDGIKKDKSSEKKRKLEDLPMYSTNASDSIDYVLWGLYSHLLPKGANSQYYDISLR